MDDMTLLNRRAVNQGALQAPVSIRLGSGLTIYDGKMIQHDGMLSAALLPRSVIPDPRALHVMKVAQKRTGKRRLAGVPSFVSPRVTQPASSIQSAVFTDSCHPAAAGAPGLRRACCVRRKWSTTT